MTAARCKTTEKQGGNIYTPPYKGTSIRSFDECPLKRCREGILT